MKKIIIGALVGGLIIFAWQCASFTFLKMHRSAEKYTPQQDSILSYLDNHLETSGNYVMPNLPDNATADQYTQMMKANMGKPSAIVLFHRHNNMDMMHNMVHGFLIDVLLAAFLCWILWKMNSPTFLTILLASVFTGLIVFLNAQFTYHIWYESFGMEGDAIDAVASFGLAGLWFGWWLRRK